MDSGTSPRFDDYRVEHDFEGLGRRVIRLNARRIEHLRLILLGIRDVTERERAEEALRSVSAELRQADQRKDAFLAMLSHELRNPLAVIRNSLYVLEHAAPGSEPTVAARSVMQRQVSQLSRLVEGLLDLTRIVRGEVELRRELLDLNALTVGVVEDYREVFLEGGIELELVAAAGDAWVDGDATRLVQMIGNLLQNCSKFTPRGGKVSVSVERDEVGGRAVVRVRDNGRGFTSEAAPHLFEPFMQADVSLDRKLGGIGLGLAVVKGLVEMHGGTVDAASPGLGQGATFALSFPLQAKRPVPAPPVEAELDRSARRILVVDDNVDAARSLGEVFELDGHVVALAFTAAEALAKARSFQPDVVVSDLGLPEVDGYELARTLRADAELGGVVLIALSGYSGADVVARAREAGFDAHVAKPPDLDALARAIQVKPTRVRNP
jgi:signal transduction histidine kinase/CheY-like chemotaxis protein